MTKLELLREQLTEAKNEIADLKQQLARACSRANQWYIRASYLEGKLEQHEMQTDDGGDEEGDEGEAIIVGKWE